MKKGEGAKEGKIEMWRRNTEDGEIESSKRLEE